MRDDLDHDTRTRVRELLARDRKIEAIKVYREATGVGLAAAKHAVEALGKPTAVPDASAAEARALDDLHVRELLLSGRKIEAIKYYREARGTGLREAKEAVEAIERSLPPAPGGHPASRSGCGGAAALAIAVVAIALFLR